MEARTRPTSGAVGVGQEPGAKHPSAAQSLAALSGADDFAFVSPALRVLSLVGQEIGRLIIDYSMVTYLPRSGTHCAIELS